LQPLHPEVVDLFERRRLTVIAGPCVAESLELCLTLARELRARAAKRGLAFIFKASFDKANRTSIRSYRGPGLEEGLRLLERVKAETGVAVLTDIHEPAQASRVAAVVDVLQIPAFLCRQTDVIVAAAKTGAPVNVKKGQFLAPEDMRHVAAKHREALGGPLSVTERGASFGYHNLVVDMRSLVIMREVTGAPVVFDATHSVQRPGGGDGVTLGERTMAPVLARAAAAVGIDGLFTEAHTDPESALSDGSNSLTLELFDGVLDEVSAIDAARRRVARPEE
jgi:2-dehydro-3-deoxyphosphooctonate aldolase (KDO 8-P synthase)